MEPGHELVHTILDLVPDTSQAEPANVHLLYGIATGPNTVQIAGSAVAMTRKAIVPVKSGDYVAVLVAGNDRLILGKPDANTTIMQNDGPIAATLTAMSVGTTGAVNHQYWVYVGGPNPGDRGILHVMGRLIWGTAGTRTFPTSTSRIGLPPEFEAVAWYTSGLTVGDYTIVDATDSGVYDGSLWLVGSTTLRPVLRTIIGANVRHSSPAATLPITWADGDYITYAANLWVKRV